jgi:hypothetical protein
MEAFFASASPGPSLTASAARDFATRAAWLATCVACALVAAIGAASVALLWRLGDAETASANASDAGGASDASGLNVGYALAGLAALGSALLLAFVVAEYQKIAALFELVERCASDPTALREVVAEQVHSRATASDGKTPPNTRPEHPSAAPNTNWETLAFAGPVATLLGAAPPAVVRAVEGDAAAAAAGYGAVVDAAATINNSVAPKSAVSIDIPDEQDPDAAIREYVTAALVKVPDEIMRVVFRNAVAGPAWCAIAGAVLLVASAAESSKEGGSSGLLVTLGVILLVFGLLGVVAAYLAYVSVRTLVLAALVALVADTTDRMAPATAVGAGVAKMAKDVGRSVADSVESAKGVVAESVGAAGERAMRGVGEIGEAIEARAAKVAEGASALGKEASERAAKAAEAAGERASALLAKAKADLLGGGGKADAAKKDDETG